MGNGTLPSFVVQPGPNHNMLVESNFVASPEHPELAREFLQRYVAGTTLFASYLQIRFSLAR